MIAVGNSEKIKKILAEKSQYRECLFARGYLITEDHVNEKTYPFYSLWKKMMIQGYQILIHKDQDFCIFSSGNRTFLLIGHAYNPFNGVYEETILLSQAAEMYDISLMAFLEEIGNWTGIFCVFVFDKTITAVQDCAGIKALYYGKINGKLCFVSHPQLVADLYGLKMDPFVRKLIHNRFYHIGNRYLPGDLSPFKEIKRIGANVYLSCDEKKNITIHRFYPVRALDMCQTETDYHSRIREACRILRKNLELTAKKWPNCAISLSGGTDSKTTLACANGMYDKFHYFSFQSKASEAADAAAAGKICKKTGVDHDVFPIPGDNGDIVDFAELKAIMAHSCGYVLNLPDHEIRKYICLYRRNDWDTEVKSWCSEIVRVFFERKYGTTFPAKLSPRHFSIFQTRYFASPLLLHRSDQIYRQYMQKFGLAEPKFNYEHTDLYYWEVRMSSWGMLVTQSLDLCHRVTFPFNNRKLIELMLTLPREKRKSDQVHRDIIALANRTIGTTDAHVQNQYFHARRILLEYLYLKYRTFFKK